MVNKVLNVDCMEYMKDIPSNYFDLAIVDPPYGIGADIKNSTSKKQSLKSATISTEYGLQRWDNEVPDIKYFTELFRVTKNQIVWGVNYYPYSMLSGGRLYWNKCVTMPTYSDGELAFCSMLNSIKSFKYAWHGMIQEKMGNKEIRIHPTQKPVDLYKWLLQNYAKEGHKILDTHIGSGSIRIACHDMGYELHGCELDKDYFEAQEERFKKHTQQAELFEFAGGSIC